MYKKFKDLWRIEQIEVPTCQNRQMGSSVVRSLVSQFDIQTVPGSIPTCDKLEVTSTSKVATPTWSHPPHNSPHFGHTSRCPLDYFTAATTAALSQRDSCVIPSQDSCITRVDSCIIRQLIIIISSASHPPASRLGGELCGGLNK